jgi:hypothetical protein
MQVAHQQDHITHAVIGGAATIDFGISSSAEFFNILSSTLYKDQILAVVREVLCNAWDAHIEAGIIDRAVEITLLEDKFTIRDFGTGIHRNDMGQIYGTYGNSTKKNDGQQTGGFGLGCKAPFAYTDHFEVISHHDGVRTIYNLSKSSAAARGKPGIVPIASFPTTESGLQVSIDIHNATDFKRFQRLVRRIARNGDMNMKVNGDQISKLGFDTVESNYLITLDQQQEIMDADGQRIMVRYGNVIYPVDRAGSISLGFDQVVGHLDKLKVGHSRSYSIIFQAPPHSISVTPSRESLSMQEHTVATLNGLFAGFMEEVNGGFVPACHAYAEMAVKMAVAQTMRKDLLSRECKLPYVMDKSTPNKISDLVTMARRYMESNYPSGLAFRKKDITWRLEGMAASGQLDRGMVQTFMRELANVTTTKNCDEWDFPKEQRTMWLQRHVIAPIINKMGKAGIDYTRLYVLDKEDTRVPDNYYYKDKEPIALATDARPMHLFNTLPYMRKIVVVSTSAKGIHDRAKRHDVLKTLGTEHGYLFFKASMKKKERETELAFFKALGMVVVDLTFRQEWEASPSRSSGPRKPARKGLPSLKAMKLSDGSVDTQQVKQDTVLRIVNPEFSVCVSLRKENPSSMLGRFDGKCTSHIIDLWGDKGVIINNSTLHEKAIKAGAMELEAYVEKKVVEVMLNSPRILEYWAFDRQRACDHFTVYSDEAAEMIKVVYNSELLRNQFQLVNNLTDDEKKIIPLYRTLQQLQRYGLSAEMKAVEKLLADVPIDPLNGVLIEKFRHPNPLLAVFDKKALTRMLRKASPTSPQIIKMTQILAIALN